MTKHVTLAELASELGMDRSALSQGRPQTRHLDLARPVAGDARAGDACR